MEECLHVMKWKHKYLQRQKTGFLTKSTAGSTMALLHQERFVSVLIKFAQHLYYSSIKENCINMVLVFRV